MGQKAAAKNSMLGQPVSVKQLDGRAENNIQCRNLLQSANNQVCSDCWGGGRGRYWFFYPKCPQDRRSIAITGHDVNQSRLVSSASRKSANINVAAGLYSSNSVSAIFGNGVGASSYALSHGVKLEKEQHVSSSLVKQL